MYSKRAEASFHLCSRFIVLDEKIAYGFKITWFAIVSGCRAHTMTPFTCARLSRGFQNTVKTFQKLLNIFSFNG